MLSQFAIILRLVTLVSGEWRCQVTAGSYEDDDALSSKRARLVVRVPPQGPRIFHDGVALGPSVSYEQPSSFSSKESVG